MHECVSCQIVAGESPASIFYENIGRSVDLQSEGEA